MKNVVAAFNSSIQFNKHNFWIDPKSKNQYFVGVQYYEKDIKSIETLLDIPITTNRPDKPKQPIPLRNVVSIDKITRADRGHPLQHSAHDRADAWASTAATWATSPTTSPRCSTSSATLDEPGKWSPYDPEQQGEKVRLPGSKIVLSAANTCG